MTDVTENLAYLHSEPSVVGTLKAKPEHFFVSEELGFSPSGAGEHLFVQIRKKGENTKYVANELAKACGVKSRDVSWAGLKDRHAITEQWFSVHLPGKVQPNLCEFAASHEGVEAILQLARHHQKLRPGNLVGNRFALLITNIKGDKEQVETRLEKIQQQGVPNYFGSQRFGHEANNLVAARDWGQAKIQVKEQSKRSFYLSAARSHLFNLVLSARIEQAMLEPMLGDLLINHLDTKRVESISAAKQLLNTGWKLTGPMTGDNALPTFDQAQEFEQNILNTEPNLLALIRANRMQHDRRALLLQPTALTWQWENDDLRVNFGLPAGAFATAVMREVIKGKDSAYIDL